MLIFTCHCDGASILCSTTLGYTWMDRVVCLRTAVLGAESRRNDCLADQTFSGTAFVSVGRPVFPLGTFAQWLCRCGFRCATDLDFEYRATSRWHLCTCWIARALGSPTFSIHIESVVFVGLCIESVVLLGPPQLLMRLDSATAPRR